MPVHDAHLTGSGRAAMLPTFAVDGAPELGCSPVDLLVLLTDAIIGIKKGELGISGKSQGTDISSEMTVLGEV